MVPPKLIDRDMTFTATALTLSISLTSFAGKFFKRSQPNCDDGKHRVGYFARTLALLAVSCALARRAITSFRHNYLLDFSRSSTPSL
jgi:hypothetical protein